VSTLGGVLLEGRVRVGAVVTVAATVAPTPIIERLERTADGPLGIRFVGNSVKPAEGPDRVSWRQLHDEACAVGAALQARGLIPGDHVAILGPTSRSLITIIRGCWMAGIASMVLPLPMRMGSLDAFIDSTRARIRHGDAKLLLIDDALAGFYQSAVGDPPIEPMAAVMPGPGNPGADALEIPAPDPERLVILQYTSGSTSEPKGVMIPDRVLGSNIDAATDVLQIVEDDVLVSWLPLYHDMGLVGCLGIPMLYGVELVQAAPQDFLAHPGNWMQWISDYRGTTTAGPNFSWVLATRALKRMEGLDLSQMRVALSGAEPVDPAAVEAFVAASSRFGFPAGAVFPAFGMAEVAIAGSFPPPMRGLVCDDVDRIVLERDRRAVPIAILDPDDAALVARRLPVLGFPVPGLEFKIVDPETHAALPERCVGELLIRGTSVTSGYYKRPDATAALFRDGWLCTGDLGYLLNGELVLCGRIKDVIIVGGRNVFPEDIERAVGGVEGVRAGNVIAFGMEGYKGKESVVVVAEVRGGDLEVIQQIVHSTALDVCGIPPRDVILVQPGTLPKTSSGKLQRSKCRELYLAEELDVVATRDV
jgi:fatty-acyl-CoA synthase